MWDEAATVEEWLEENLNGDTDGAYFEICGDERIYQAMLVVTEAWMEVD